MVLIGDVSGERLVRGAGGVGRHLPPQSVQVDLLLFDGVRLRRPVVPQAGLPEFGHLEQRVDVKREVESVRPDAVVLQDEVVLENAQDAVTVCSIFKEDGKKIQKAIRL